MIKSPASRQTLPLPPRGAGGPPRLTVSEVRGRLDALERRAERIESALHGLDRSIPPDPTGPDPEDLEARILGVDSLLGGLILALEEAGLVEVILPYGGIVGVVTNPERAA